MWWEIRVLWIQFNYQSVFFRWSWESGEGSPNLTLGLAFEDLFLTCGEGPMTTGEVWPALGLSEGWLCWRTGGASSCGFSFSRSRPSPIISIRKPFLRPNLNPRLLPIPASEDPARDRITDNFVAGGDSDDGLGNLIKWTAPWWLGNAAWLFSSPEKLWREREPEVAHGKILAKSEDR